MSRSFAKLTWTLALALALLHAVPAPAGPLVCTDARAELDCCGESSTPEPAFVERGDCRCCVAVQIASTAVDATGHKVFDHACESNAERIAAFHRAAPLLSSCAGPGTSRLSSLRTVVLLI